MEARRGRCGQVWAGAGRGEAATMRAGLAAAAAVAAAGLLAAAGLAAAGCARVIDPGGDGQPLSCVVGDSVDCYNPQCASHPACLATGDEVCGDFMDNDGDTWIDCLDPDCIFDPACGDDPPGGPEICTNELDDDGDGLIDCQDEACSGHPACDDAEDCGNGYDDDGDGLADCDDGDCAADPLCDVAPGTSGAACTSFADCGGAECLDEASTGFPGGYCSAYCSVDSDCGAGGLCADTMCFKSCASNADCRSGYACFPGWDVGDYMCAPLCGSDADCPATASCNEWSGICDIDRGLAKVGEPCTDDMGCESMRCLDLSYGFPGGYCVSVCSLSVGSCPGDALCADVGEMFVGMCFDGCSGDVDCRTPDYSCDLTMGGMCLPPTL